MPKALQVLASLPKLMKKDVKNNPVTVSTRCGHVVRDFESEAKTRCNFQF